MTARDPWFDNAKMALVTLVVVGHALVMLPSTGLNQQLYAFVYAWHMPAFVLLTGYFSQRFVYSPTNFLKLFQSVVVPYLIFEYALAMFRIQVGGEHLENLFLHPHWPMWYLAAMFCWRLMTPVFRKLPWHPWLPLAVAVTFSLTSGLWPADFLDLSRVFGFLPFFVMGLCATPEAFERLRRPGTKGLAVVVLAGAWVVMGYLDQVASKEWLYYRTSYPELDVSDERGLVIRAAVLAIGAVSAWAVLALVPRTGGWFARMGAASVIVYLFHGFTVKALEYTSYPAWAADAPILSLAINAVGAVGVALLLASPPVAGRLQNVVDPLGFALAQVERAHALHHRAAELRERPREAVLVG